MEYESGSFSDIKDIGTRPVEGKECPQFKVEGECFAVCSVSQPCSLEFFLTLRFF